MKTFKQFIKEAPTRNIVIPWYVESLDLEEVINLLNTDYSESFEQLKKDGYVLFKGLKSGWEEEYALVDPTNSLRRSKNFSGSYQFLMDLNPGFKNFPSRTKSIICSGDFQEADSYGMAYCVLPINGTKIAVSSSSDFIKTKFENYYFKGSISGFDEVVVNFLLNAGINEIKFRDEDVSTINTKLKEIDPIILTLLFIQSASGEVGSIQHFPSDLYSGVNRFYLNPRSWKKQLNDPDSKFKEVIEFIRNNGFATKEANDLLTAFKSGNPLDALAKGLTPEALGVKMTSLMGVRHTECWFSDKCLILPYNILERIRHRNRLRMSSEDI